MRACRKPQAPTGGYWSLRGENRVGLAPGPREEPRCHGEHPNTAPQTLHGDGGCAQAVLGISRASRNTASLPDFHSRKLRLCLWDICKVTLLRDAVGLQTHVA